jgi:hypothetical protein
MDINFEKLFEVKLSNNFYSDCIPKDFRIEPSSHTRNVMNNCRVISRETQSGLIALIELADLLVGKPVVRLENKTKLSFVIFSSNPFLKNFTDLSLDGEPNSIYHFSNLNDNIQNTELLLSARTSEKFVSDDDLIVLNPTKFYYNQSFTNSSAFIQIKDLEGNAITDKIVKPVNNQLNYYVDLSFFLPGRYKLFVDGSLKLDFYADDSLASKNIFGIVDIYFSRSVPSAYLLTDLSGKISEKSYAINFKKRRTIWKYLVVLKFKSTINPSDISLTYRDLTNSFKKLAPVILSDGYTAVPFTSNNEIDFSDATIQGIMLKKTNGTGIIEIENLPNASYKNIKPDLANNKVFSEIFIYL